MATDPDEPKGERGEPSGSPNAGGARDPKKPPPAGPHADPSLINPDATPGAGTLPPAGPLGDDETDQATG